MSEAREGGYFTCKKNGRSFRSPIVMTETEIGVQSHPSKGTDALNVSVIRHFRGLGRFARFASLCALGAFGPIDGFGFNRGGDDRRRGGFFFSRWQGIDGVENLLQID
jgi:hypothetical protein